MVQGLQYIFKMKNKLAKAGHPFGKVESLREIYCSMINSHALLTYFKTICNNFSKKG